MVMEEQQSDMELDSERVPVPQVQQQQQQQQQQRSVNDNSAQRNKDSGISRNKPRLRKKALHAAITKQMEFYFSDANLGKDRFLSSLIKDGEDSYVDLNVFLTFNKIKELTTDVNRIAKALQGSTILSLSEDGTKVRRVTPVVKRKKENIDDCTVYVQNLPPDADHEILKSIFSQYGEVVYISIPKFRNKNRKIKGFAFIEFDTPESANKCLKAFRRKGRILPSYTAPGELLSITTFDEPEKDVVKRIGANLNENNCTENEEMKEEENDEEQSRNYSLVDDDTVEVVEKKAVKRKHKDSEFAEYENEEQQQLLKDIKIENDEEITTNCTLENDKIKIEEKSKKRKHKDSEFSEYGNEVQPLKDIKIDRDEDTDYALENDNIKVEEKTIKKRKHKDSEFPESEQEKQDGEPVKIKKKKLHVNEDQLEKANRIKEEVTENNCEEQMATDDDGASEQRDKDRKKKKKRKKRKQRSKLEEFGSYSMGLQAMAKKDWKQLRNKYLELQRNKMKQLKQHLRKTRWSQWSTAAVAEKSKNEKEEEEVKDKKQGVSFTPGVIVKIEMDKPCTDPKGLKMELRNNNNSVKYIDVEDASYFAYVRCDTNEAAQALVQKSNEEKQMTILEGEEEQAYWGKILSDREEKLTKKVPRPKQRGRNKLLKRAEKELGKHIKFDEV